MSASVPAVVVAAVGAIVAAAGAAAVDAAATVGAAIVTVAAATGDLVGGEVGAAGDADPPHATSESDDAISNIASAMPVATRRETFHIMDPPSIDLVTSMSVAG